MIPVKDLPKPKCPQGYTHSEINVIFQNNSLQIAKFWDWMTGQTQSVCDGRRYNHDKREYEPTECAGNEHGIVTYYWDVECYVNHHQNGTMLIWD